MVIREPKKALPASYRPTGGLPYKVGERDSWSSVAAKHGVDPLWLVQYNFETRDPGEVNWYLKHRIGCRKTTANGKNLMFSSADAPGIIYVPNPQKPWSRKNLKYGSYGIVIEGDDDYRLQVDLTLDRIAGSDVGMVLLNAIRRSGRVIEISPWVGTSCNATATSSNIRDATAAEEVVLKGGSSFEQLKEPSLLRDLLDLPREPVMGTGTGSDGKVNFSPSMFGYGASGACSPYAGAPGASPSQVLFHELAHAYRYCIGKFHSRPTIGGSSTYTNVEEFFAVVLTNVLIADPTYSGGNRTLRADHAGFAPLAPNLCTSRGFVSHIPNRNMMRELVAGDPNLAKSLQGVKSSFNPFVESL